MPLRRAVLALLADDTHPTADDFYQHRLSTIPGISRATVYNTFRELSDVGELTTVHHMGEGGQCYNTNTGPHHHLHCIRCQKLIDFDHDF